LVALRAWGLLNDKTLDVRTYYTASDVAKLGISPGSGGMTFTPDGKYLFLKDAGSDDGRAPVTNLIIDTTTGKQLAKFGEGRGSWKTGIAVSPNGELLALGNRTSVELLRMKYPH
jgi:DNA-binding beta-propeller fold protein YncE